MRVIFNDGDEKFINNYLFVQNILDFATKNKIIYFHFSLKKKDNKKLGWDSTRTNYGVRGNCYGSYDGCEITDIKNRFIQSEDLSTMICKYCLSIVNNKTKEKSHPQKELNLEIPGFTKCTKCTWFLKGDKLADDKNGVCGYCEVYFKKTGKYMESMQTEIAPTLSSESVELLFDAVSKMKGGSNE